MELLYSFGAGWMLPIVRGETPYARCRERKKITKVLRTAQGHVEVMEQLYSFGAGVDAPNSEG